MPQARKSTRSTSRRSAAFKEPAALKQLNRSLETAQKALTDLRKHAGRDAGKSTKSLHGDLRKFVSNAKQHSGKFGTALKRDFDQAQKAVAGASASGSSRSQARRSSTRRASTGTAAKRTTGTSTKRRTGTSAKRTTGKSR